MPVFGRIFGDSARVGPPAADAVIENAAADRSRFSAYNVLAGMPQPLGATATGGVNFAVYSGGASAATLCLFTRFDLKQNRVTEEIPLDGQINKTGSIWHVFLEGKFRDIAYGYKFDGKFIPEEGLYFDKSIVLLDPYAKVSPNAEEYPVEGFEECCFDICASLCSLDAASKYPLL